MKDINLLGNLLKIDKIMNFIYLLQKIFWVFPNNIFYMSFFFMNFVIFFAVGSSKKVQEFNLFQLIMHDKNTNYS